MPNGRLTLPPGQALQLTPQQRIGVALGDNRVNSSGAPLGSVKSRTSQFIANIVPAGKTLPVPATGTQFYVTAATAPIQIRPAGGVFNEYAIGTGLQLIEQNAFDLLEIKNDEAFNVVFQIFVGFDQFIDKRLILDLVSQPNVAYPTYPTANASPAVAINDLSGAQFADINGNQWYALAREAIYVSNVDTGVTLLLQKAGAATSNGPAVAAIYPQTSLRFPVSGNYSLSVGGGNINAIVSEIYQSIPKT